MVGKRRKPKLSKGDLRKIAHGLDKFGDMLVMLGKIQKMEQEIEDFNRLWKKFSRADPRKLFSEIENDPELLNKMTFFTKKLEEVFLITEEDPDEMPPDEQIEAGKSFKELSSLLNEIVESIGQAETLSE